MHYFFNKGNDSLLTDAGWITFAEIKLKNYNVVTINSTDKPSLERATIVLDLILRKYSDTIAKGIIIITAEQLKQNPRPYFAMTNPQRNTLKSGQDQLTRFIISNGGSFSGANLIFEEPEPPKPVKPPNNNEISKLKHERVKLDKARFEAQKMLKQVEIEQRKLDIQVFLYERTKLVNAKRLANGEDISIPPKIPVFITATEETELKRTIAERTQRDVAHIENAIQVAYNDKTQLKDLLKLGEVHACEEDINMVEDCVIACEEVANVVETNVKPVETDAKPVETDAKAVETEAKPVETDAKAVETDAKAVETETKAVETETKAVETEAKALEAKALQDEINARLEQEAKDKEEAQRKLEETFKLEKIARDVAKLDKKILIKADNERKLLENALINLADLEQAKVEKYKLEVAKLVLHKNPVDINEIQAFQDKIDTANAKKQNILNSIQKLADAESEENTEQLTPPPKNLKLTCDLTYKDNEFVQDIKAATAALEQVYRKASDIVTKYDSLLSNIDLLTQDDLHYIEFNDLDLSQSKKFTSQFRTRRIERRVIKDEMYIADLLLNKPKINILEYLTLVLTKIDELENRTYSVRFPEKFLH